MLLGRCEFGKDDYSLNIINVPLENEPEIGVDKEPMAELKCEIKISSVKISKQKSDPSEPTLF
jgi:hypothetical protein